MASPDVMLGHGRVGHARIRRMRQRRGVRAAPFLLPALLLLGMFQFWPMFEAFRLSWTDASGFGAEAYVGFNNYVEAVRNPNVAASLVNTGKYAVMFTPAVIGLGLGAALLVNREDLPFRGLVRTILFLPFVVSLVVGALAWQFLVDPHVGLLSYWMSQLGRPLGDPLNSVTWAMPMVVLVGVWKMLGFYMVIFLAGLQGIPRNLYEAAQVDGATAWQKFRHVTLPGLAPAFGFVMVFALIASLQVFDQVFIMTAGGPYRSTETLVMAIYREGFSNLRIGLASTLSMILFIVTFLFSVGQYFYFGRREQDFG